ncbi:MAG TPA: EboA domain-containing protein [Polyangiaceae bacterium]|nr:EboA domain-containing protein [Polyangiaceae bacterium]
MAPLHPYLDLVATRATPAAQKWLSERLPRLVIESFGGVYSGAGRRLGMARVELNASERERLSEARLPLPEGWPLSAVGRAGLLSLVMSALAREERPKLAQSVFKTGDNDERAALLQALSILPEPEAFLELGIDACRTHVQSVFEAIACENPYPMRFFPEHNFNQMVLKSFFTGVAVKRIEGLAARRSPELVRMAEAYASERRAAGRPVPADLHLVTSPPTTTA